MGDSSDNNAPHPRDASTGGRGSVVAFPGSRVAERAASNLPAQPTSFVGREREIAEVKGLLADHRLLTLTGPGGSGKTRLALAVAADLVESFEDGVWLVELASLSDPDLVPQAVASTLGVREVPGRPLTEMLYEHLRSRKMLLVLDNCEHLVEACAVLSDGFLRFCPKVRILATSREALGIGGESTWLVPPLALPEQRLPVEELGRYEAIRLFVERARAVASSFELTEVNAPEVARVCRRLDGNPLAIELAAARVRVLSVEQISSRLEDSFTLLTGGSRTALLRQRTLRATIDWSHDLLSEEEKVLFRRLAVFARGFGLEAAEKVCAGGDIEEDEVLELLTHLVDKSLVLVTERGGAARYRMLETVRQYGQERLEESGETELLKERHATFFLRLAQEADPMSSEQEAWLKRLEREHDNLRASLRWALFGEAEDLALGLVATLWPFWYTRGYLSEGRGWIEGTISRSGPATRHTKAEALIGAGYIALFQGDYEAAKGFLERSLVLYRQLEDKEGIASSLTYLGFVAVLSQRDLETIPALYEEAMALREDIEDRRVVANLLLFSGLMAVGQGDLERAAALHEEALVVFREIRDVQGIGHCLNNLALGALMRGDYNETSALLKENLCVARESEYKLAIQYSLFGLGMVAAALGRPARAARLWGAEEAMREAFGIQITPLARSFTNYEGLLNAARSKVDEAAWEAAWSEGRAMTSEEAIEYALGTQDPAPASSKDAAASLLSAREVEILVLVAKGLTNPQVAQRLHLSPRTVGQHLRSIYRKLGVPTRAAAATEASERGLI